MTEKSREDAAGDDTDAPEAAPGVAPEEREAPPHDVESEAGAALPPPDDAAPPPPPPGGAASDAEPSQEIRQWAMFCHLAAFAGFVIPFGGVIGPLILWQMKKDVHPFLDDQGKEALNFNIAAAIAITVASFAAAIGMFIVVGILLIPVVLLLMVAWVAYVVIAAIKANEGERYRYPFTLRLVK